MLLLRRQTNNRSLTQDVAQQKRMKNDRVVERSLVGLPDDNTCLSKSQRMSNQIITRHYKVQNAQIKIDIFKEAEEIKNTRYLETQNLKIDLYNILRGPEGDGGTNLTFMIGIKD